MIDDHDKREWVNVPSGISSPGLSWTLMFKRKIVRTVLCAIIFHNCTQLLKMTDDLTGLSFDFVSIPLTKLLCQLSYFIVLLFNAV